MSTRRALGVPFLPPRGVVRLMWRARGWLVGARRRIAPPPLLLQDAVIGLYDNRVLGLLVETGLPDLLDRPRTAADLAAATGADPDALERVLRYAASRRLVTAHRGGRFGPSRLTRLLRTDGDLPWAALALRATDQEHWDTWRRLDRVVGLPSRPPAPATPAEIDAAGTTIQALALSRDVPWGRGGTVCDVGGGNGAAVEVLLQAHPGLRGVVLDRPEVVAGPRPALASGPLAARTTLVGGDFLAAVPAGHEHYLLLAVMTECDDDRAVALLRRIREAMAPGSRLLVVDNELSDAPRDEYAQHTDLLLLALGVGRERTRRQATELFTRAGLRVVAVHHLFTGSVAVELHAAGPALFPAAGDSD